MFIVQPTLYMKTQTPANEGDSRLLKKYVLVSTAQEYK